MIRRIVAGPFGLKVLCVALVWRGMAERDVALLVTALVTFWGYRIIRGGVRETYREPANQQAARQMRDMVDGHSIWPNGTETREQGIARLVTPYLAAGGKR